MRTCKIFLASSAELDTDKEKFEIFISNKNKIYQEKRIFFELVTWKDFVSAITEEHSQMKYNEYIRACDISIFLFHTKLGKYTKDEFDTAYSSFQKSNLKIKKPLIYTYFKKDNNESVQISEFRGYIDSLDHFYDTYEDLNDLFVKFNKQLESLEKGGKIIIPEKIDVKKINKYAVYYYLLPLLVLSGAFFTFYFFQPTDVTVKITEVRSIVNLPLQNGSMTITYGDKIEKQEIVNDEVIFKQIPSKYKRSRIKLRFEAPGFVTIDTLVQVDDLVDLPIKRNNSLGEIFGMVKDENNSPIANVVITVKDITVTTDNSGKFKLIIPFDKQQTEQRITAIKSGYQIWDYSTPVISQEIKIILFK